MVRDYSYSYEFDERYCYPHSDVLMNRLGIQDAEELKKAEREITYQCNPSFQRRKWKDTETIY